MPIGAGPGHAVALAIGVAFFEDALVALAWQLDLELLDSVAPDESEDDTAVAVVINVQIVEAQAIGAVFAIGALCAWSSRRPRLAIAAVSTISTLFARSARRSVAAIKALLATLAGRAHGAGRPRLTLFASGAWFAMSASRALFTRIAALTFLPGRDLADTLLQRINTTRHRSKTAHHVTTHDLDDGVGKRLQLCSEHSSPFMMCSMKARASSAETSSADG